MEEKTKVESPSKKITTGNKVKIIYKKDGGFLLKINDVEVGYIFGYTLEHDCKSAQTINFDMYCECEIEVEK